MHVMVLEDYVVATSPKENRVLIFFLNTLSVTVSTNLSEKFDYA